MFKPFISYSIKNKGIIIRIHMANSNKTTPPNLLGTVRNMHKKAKNTTQVQYVQELLMDLLNVIVRMPKTLGAKAIISIKKIRINKIQKNL